MYVWQHLFCYGNFCFDMITQQVFTVFVQRIGKLIHVWNYRILKCLSYRNISIFCLPEVCFDWVKISWSYNMFQEMLIFSVWVNLYGCDTSNLQFKIVSNIPVLNITVSNTGCCFPMIALSEALAEHVSFQVPCYICKTIWQGNI